MKEEVSKAGLAGLSSLIPIGVYIMEKSGSPQAWWAGFYLICAVGAVHIIRALVYLFRAKQ